MKRFVLIFSILICASLSIFSQQKPICDETTNYLIDKEMPSVYLTFEQFGKATDWKQAKLGEWSDKSAIQKGNDIWLRLHNNSCWEIKFRTDSLYDFKNNCGRKVQADFRNVRKRCNCKCSIQHRRAKQKGSCLRKPYRKHFWVAIRKVNFVWCVQRSSFQKSFNLC